MTDLLFTSFGFPAAGTSAPYTANRTMPARLAETKNVKDFGAVGDGDHDDSDNIQAAIDWTTLSGGLDLRGRIYFPPGTYKVTKTITLPNNAGNLNSFILEGDGASSRIMGNFSGYIFDRPLANPGNYAVYVISRLAIENGGTTESNGFGIRLNSVNTAVIEECFINAAIGVAALSDAFNVTIRNCAFTPNHGGTPIGSIGVVVAGTDFNIIGCDLGGFEHGVRCAIGGTIIGCRFEQNDIGIVGGMDINRGSRNCTAFICGNSFETNSIGIYVFSLNSSHITSSGFLGDSFSPAGPTTPPTHALLIRGGTDNTYSSLSINGQFTTAGIEYSAPATRDSWISVTANNAEAAPAWIFDADSTGTRCINCNNPSLVVSVDILPIMPVEGDQYDVNDSNLSGFRDPIDGNGTLHVRARATTVASDTLGSISNGTEAIFTASIGANFLATVAGTSPSVLTISSSSFQGNIAVGDTVFGLSAPATIASFVGGSGGPGTYNLSANVDPVSVLAGFQSSSNILNVTEVASGTIANDSTYTLNAYGVSSALITSGPGGGGIGLYTFAGGQQGWIGSQVMGAGLAGNELTLHGTTTGTFVADMVIGVLRIATRWVITGGSGPFTMSGSSSNYIGPSPVGGVLWTVCG